MIGAIGIVTLLLILGNLEAITVVHQHPNNQYVVEHEVLREDALAEAKKLEIYPGKWDNVRIGKDLYFQWLEFKVFYFEIFIKKK